MARIILAILKQGWRTAFFAMLVVAIGLQFATLTVASMNALMGGAITAVTGVKTVAQAVRTDLSMAESQRKRAREALRNSRKRMGRRVTRSVASAPSKVLPVAGAAVVVTMTVSELASACETAEVIEQALRDAPDEPASEDQDATEVAFLRFCEQNGERLQAVNAKVAPLLEPFDGVGAAVWTTATDVIEKAEVAAEEAERWQERIRNVPTDFCGHMPDWIC